VTPPRRFAMVIEDELRVLRVGTPARRLVDFLVRSALSAGFAVRYGTPYRRRPDLCSLAEFSAWCELVDLGVPGAARDGREAALRVVADLRGVRAVREVMSS
jgi:hypothetical protein